MLSLVGGISRQRQLRRQSSLNCLDFQIKAGGMFYLSPACELDLKVQVDDAEAEADHSFRRLNGRY